MTPDGVGAFAPVGSGDELARVKRARLVRATGAGAVGACLPVSEGGRAAPAAAGSRGLRFRAPRRGRGGRRPRGGRVRRRVPRWRARVEPNRGELGEAARYRSCARRRRGCRPPGARPAVIRRGGARTGMPCSSRARAGASLAVRSYHGAPGPTTSRRRDLARGDGRRVRRPRAHRSRDEGARDASSAAPTRARACAFRRVPFRERNSRRMHISREMVLAGW